MDIVFTGKYKSLNDFEWKNIGKFVVITGPNGSGKSQLLKLISGNLKKEGGITGTLPLTGISLRPEEVAFLKGEWLLSNTQPTSLATIQKKRDQLFEDFRRNNIHRDSGRDKLFSVFKNIRDVFSAKGVSRPTRAQFDEEFPTHFYGAESEITHSISDIFYNYRLDEIQLKADGLSESEIEAQIGKRPWEVLRDIVASAKLPFSFNDPSRAKIQDSFELQITHSLSGEKISFDDLSSGEKVLISLVFFLYNSQEKKSFPKILIMDEPDAHLHPSMAQQFLNVIREVLVNKYSVQVIMSTHSPSTVVLSPLDSIFIMSREDPRIRPATSKNEAVNLLTAGLVNVGEGVKYFLVEDVVDKDFYTFTLGKLIADESINADISLVFIPASTSSNTGGSTVVTGWGNVPFSVSF